MITKLAILAAGAIIAYWAYTYCPITYMGHCVSGYPIRWLSLPILALAIIIAFFWVG